MVDVNALHGELTRYVGELAAKFVNQYIPANPETSPDTYAHDVKAYCILAHAAFEDFIEEVALSLTDYAAEQYRSQRKISDVTLALLCRYGAKLKIDDDETSIEIKPFDYLRNLVEEAKTSFSKEIHKNHGVSILYLRSLLIPVAIEITQDANQLNSLRKLSEGRGAYAHKARVRSVLAPEDAKRYVEDVLALCDDVRAKAVSEIARLQ
ncbi:MAG: HEPN domain-containing protein [Nitrospira sp.]|nr:HEPN domain-containing protein [Nitrospira sp.]